MLIDGTSEDEIPALPVEQVQGLIPTGEPVVFRIGSATMLGEFRVNKQSLHIELAQIEGGEGVLLTLGEFLSSRARFRLPDHSDSA